MRNRDCSPDTDSLILGFAKSSTKNFFNSLVVFIVRHSPYTSLGSTLFMAITWASSLYPSFSASSITLFMSSSLLFLLGSNDSDFQASYAASKVLPSLANLLITNILWRPLDLPLPFHPNQTF